MSSRMLIDARHPEETRVAVVRGNRIEEFDYESADKKQLKGNIYLAKVTRVEASLQAAFVEYGGNRHGFLAFNEIHPDYYQIPLADREALLAEEAAARAELAAEDDEAAEASAGAANDDDDQQVEQISGDDEIEEAMTRRPDPRRLRRRYKIQEVIKRRQILLIQVVKEERGNKGAALTTYMSLAGRYCVLMPNSTHGGGISRKISQSKDRKRLKTIMSALQVPDGMGCIIRTAGMSRTKAEIKRDFDYLVRMWDGIRELTLKSVAPTLIYEEGNLIKRSIRDLYHRDIDEIQVEGEDGYRTAKEFMRLLMPSHAKRVQNYKEQIPLFHRYQVEAQLDSMYSPTVQLKSGGYIVMNATEALVAIDVNSGRATKEHNIEETALNTNLEAADEIARQLRLRDLAGLIVIDFIDMEERSNNRSIERRMKDALKSDRARIQVGRISTFGLMEMSRQRLRPNLMEASMVPCAHCGGTGVIRSVGSASLNALRVLEEEGIRGRSAEVTLYLPGEAAIYVLNRKRAVLRDLEQRYGFTIAVLAKDDLHGEPYLLERVGVSAERTSDSDTVVTPDGLVSVGGAAVEGLAPAANDEESEDKPRKRRRRRRKKPRRGRGEEDMAATASDGEDTPEPVETTEADAAPPVSDEDAPAKKRRRGRRGGQRGRTTPAAEAQTDTDADADATAVADEPEAPAPQEQAAEDGDASEPEAKKPARQPRKRAPARRGRATAKAEDVKAEPSAAEASGGDQPADEPKERKQPVRRRTRKAPAQADGAAAEKQAQDTGTADQGGKEAPKEQAGATEPAPSAPREPAPVFVEAGPADPSVVNASSAPDASDKKKPSRKGWWQRTFGP